MRTRLPLLVAFAATLAFTGCSTLPQSVRTTEPEPSVIESSAGGIHLQALRTSTAKPVMHVHYIDVGQGLSVLIDFPCGAVLIDTGGAAKDGVKKLTDYLEAFFAARPDLNRTLNAVYCTHPHDDHTLGLREVVENFNVKGYVDDGHTAGGGGTNPRWVRDEISSGRRTIKLREVPDEEVKNVPGLTGLTDSVIDPVKCATCDPIIRILSGGRNMKGTWSDDDFKNPNNSSLTIRIDFGKASVLVEGDLETKAIKDLIARTPKKLIDVDVYTAGHHGAENGTLQKQVDIMTPKIAGMGVGAHNDGENPRISKSAYTYGHPRVVVLDMLQNAMSDTLSTPVPMIAATGYDKTLGHGIFAPYTITKPVYGTGWNGNIVITATLDGKYAVRTDR